VCCVSSRVRVSTLFTDNEAFHRDSNYHPFSQDDHFAISTSRKVSHEKQRLLVADDEADLVAELKPLLERSGFEITIAGDGEQALKLIEQVEPDLVILDVMMLVWMVVRYCVVCEG